MNDDRAAQLRRCAFRIFQVAFDEANLSAFSLLKLFGDIHADIAAAENDDPLVTTRIDAQKLGQPVGLLGFDCEINFVALNQLVRRPDCEQMVVSQDGEDLNI